MSGIGQRMAVGAGWMVMMRFADRVVGLVSIAVLARLLVPADFGLVALAMSLIAFLDTIGELSVELVLIRDQKAERHHYDTAWTLNIIRALAFAGTLAVLAVPAAEFFSEPRVVAVIYWLALGVAIKGFENIGIVDFRKHLNFHLEFLYVMSSRVLGTVVTMVLAFLWPGPSALVAGLLIRRVAMLVLSFTLHGFRPRLSLAAFREIFTFSKWVMVEHMLIGVRKHAHRFAIGRFIGAEALGLYSVAHEIALLASSEIEQPIRRAVFPGYAKVASDPALLRKAFLDVYGMIAVLGAPAAVGVGILADLIVPFMLGPKWLETIPLIRILSLFGLMVVMAGGTRLVYLAANKPYMATMLSALDAAMVPVTLLGAVWGGVAGVAWVMVVAATVTWVTAMTLVMRFLRIRVRDIAGRSVRVAIALGGMALAVGSAPRYAGSEAGLAASGAMLVVYTALGVAVYAGLVFGLWLLSGRPEGAERQALNAGRAWLQWLQARRSRPQTERVPS